MPHILIHRTFKSLKFMARLCSAKTNLIVKTYPFVNPLNWTTHNFNFIFFGFGRKYFAWFFRCLTQKIFNIQFLVLHSINDKIFFYYYVNVRASVCLSFSLIESFINLFIEHNIGTKYWIYYFAIGIPDWQLCSAHKSWLY